MISSIYCLANLLRMSTKKPRRAKVDVLVPSCYGMQQVHCRAAYPSRPLMPPRVLISFSFVQRSLYSCMMWTKRGRLSNHEAFLLRGT